MDKLAVEGPHHGAICRTDGYLERGYFDAKYVRLLLDEHSRGRRDHSHALWTLWMLELWHRRYIDQLRVIRLFELICYSYSTQTHSAIQNSAGICPGWFVIRFRGAVVHGADCV